MHAPREFKPLFRTSPVLELIGPLYSAGKGRDLVLGLRAGAKHCNSRGSVHGGILATLADVALGYNMAYSSDPPRNLVTANLTLDYAGTAKAGDWLEAHVDIQKQGSRLSFANCYILVDGQRIVRASAVFLAAERNGAKARSGQESAGAPGPAPGLDQAGAIAIAGYVPGAIGRVAELHAAYYAKAWDFGLYFEAKVAAELSQFLQHLDPARDGFWTAIRSGCVEGAIAIDGAQAETHGAHLRWFILSDALRAQGVGNRLLQAAVDLCRQRNYARVFLWTFQGLEPARHLYEKFGFCLAEQIEGEQRGKRVLEQRYVLELA